MATTSKRKASGRGKSAAPDKDTLLKYYREMLLIRRFE